MKEQDSWSTLKQQAERMQLTPRASAWFRIKEKLDHRQGRRIHPFRIMNIAAIGLLLVGMIAIMRWWTQQSSVKLDGEVLMNQTPAPIAQYPNLQRYQHSAPDYADHVQLTAAGNIQRHLQFANAMDKLPEGAHSWVAPLQGTWILANPGDAGKLPWKSITFNPVGVFQWEGSEAAQHWQFLKLPDQSTYYILQNNPETLLLIRYAGSNELTVLLFDESSGTFKEFPMRLSQEG